MLVMHFSAMWIKKKTEFTGFESNTERQGSVERGWGAICQSKNKGWNH